MPRVIESGGQPAVEGWQASLERAVLTIDQRPSLGELSELRAGPAARPFNEREEGEDDGEA